MDSPYQSRSRISLFVIALLTILSLAPQGVRAQGTPEDEEAFAPSTPLEDLFLRVESSDVFVQDEAVGVPPQYHMQDGEFLAEMGEIGEDLQDAGAIDSYGSIVRFDSEPGAGFSLLMQLVTFESAAGASQYVDLDFNDQDGAQPEVIAAVTEGGATITGYASETENLETIIFGWHDGRMAGIVGTLGPPDLINASNIEAIVRAQLACVRADAPCEPIPFPYVASGSEDTTGTEAEAGETTDATPDATAEAELAQPETPLDQLILRVEGGNGYDLYRINLDEYVTIQGQSQVELDQVTLDYFDETGVVDNYRYNAEFLEPGSAIQVGVVVRLATFPDAGAAAEYLDGMFETLAPTNAALSGLALVEDIPDLPGNVNGWTAMIAYGDGTEHPYLRYNLQSGPVVISVEMFGTDASLLPALAEDLLRSQLDCAIADAPCAPVLFPDGISSEPMTDAETESPDEAATVGETATVTAATANVRAEPTTSANVVATVVAGDTVIITGESVEADGFVWYPVVVEDGTAGWIAGQLIGR